MPTSASSIGKASSWNNSTLMIYGVLLALAALAWAWLFQLAIEMKNMPGAIGYDLPGFVAMWTVMMAAMMFPTLAPVASLYVRAVCKRSHGVIRSLRILGLVCGYLTVWALFGIFAFVVARVGGSLSIAAPTVVPWIGATVIAVCGLYQFTPFKDLCLSHCRSPIGFLFHFGNFRGKLRDLRVGFYHGGFCAGCCWALMLVMITVGVMNLTWMVGLTIIIVLEKTWRYGQQFSFAVGFFLIILACFIPWYPSLLSGLYIDI